MFNPLGFLIALRQAKETRQLQRMDPDHLYKNLKRYFPSLVNAFISDGMRARSDVFEKEIERRFLAFGKACVPNKDPLEYHDNWDGTFAVTVRISKECLDEIVARNAKKVL